MPESTWNLYNATGSNATECDGSGTRHDNNITGGKATGNSTGTGGKATDIGTGTGGKATKNFTGGKATDNDSILLNLSKILMRLIRYEKRVKNYLPCLNACSVKKITGSKIVKI